MATNELLAWDPSYVDPTDRPADGLIIRSVGGRTGPISLENGATLSFPWKKQQQITDATPATMKVTEVQSTPRHTQELRVLGGNLISGSTAPQLFLASPYADDAATGYSAQVSTGNRSTESASSVYLQAGVTGSGDRKINISSDTTTVFGDFVVGGYTMTGAWDDNFTTIRQGATTPTHTITYSRRKKLGDRMIIWTFLLNVTSAGAASPLTLDLPSPAVVGSNMAVGSGYLYNGASNIIGPWGLNSTTTIALLISTGFYSTAVASGNVITGTILYESAS